MTKDEFLNIFNGSVELISEDYPDSVFFYYTKNTERFYKLNIITDNVDENGYYEDYNIKNIEIKSENILFEVLHDKKEIWISDLIFNEFKEDKYFYIEDLIYNTDKRRWDKIYDDIYDFLKSTIAKDYTITRKQFF